MFDMDKYIRIPFVDGGRDFAGCDCGGLVRLFYEQESGITLPDYGIGCLDAIGIDAVIRSNLPMWHRIDNPMPVCVALMRTDDDHPTLCDHFGIVYRPGWMLHTNRKTGCITTRLDHPYWGKTIAGYYVYIGR